MPILITRPTSIRLWYHYFLQIEKNSTDMDKTKKSKRGRDEDSTNLVCIVHVAGLRHSAMQGFSTCKDPKKKHSGRYTLCVKLEKDSKFTSAYLDVEGSSLFHFFWISKKSVSFVIDSDPEFYFLEKLEENCQGYTNRPVSLHCRVNAKGANVKWFKGGQAINVRILLFRYLINIMKCNGKIISATKW